MASHGATVLNSELIEFSKKYLLEGDLLLSEMPKGKVLVVTIYFSE